MKKFTAKDFLRYSIVSFIVGIIFLIISIYVAYIPSKQFTTFEFISAIFMALAIILFPYISRAHKDNIPIYILKVLGYIILVVITAISIWVLIPIYNVITNSPNVWWNIFYWVLIIVSPCLLFVVLNITIKRIIAIVSYISSKIKCFSENNNTLQTSAKKVFACIGGGVAFIVSILTIVLTTLDIIEKLSK